METIKLIGRSSRLSLLQIDIVKRKIQVEFPDMKREVIARNSKGDALQNVPLHTVEGREEMATVFLKKTLPPLCTDGEFAAIEPLAEKNLVNSEAGHLEV
jgi:Porphobilinogen deaminase, dipyromethane cofactor binding domain